MSYLGKAELKNSNIRRWTGVPGAVSTIAHGTLGFVPFNEPSTFITVNGIKQHDTAFSLTAIGIEFASPLDAADEVEVVCIFDVGVPVTTADNTIGISQLDVTEGNANDVLTTDGAGNLSFTGKSTETLTSLGVTSTAAELNILDGATVSTAELNILDGVTSTAAELNYVSGVTSSIQTQIDGKETADSTIVKTGNANTFTAEQTFGEVTETVYNLSGLDIDPANGGKQYKTLGGTTNFTSSIADGQSVRLRIVGGDTHVVNWPDPATASNNITAIKWVTSAGNAAPAATADDVFVLEREGTILYIYYLGSAV